jgi:hypothetical protein
MTEHAQPTPEQEAVNGAYLLRRSISEDLARTLLDPRADADSALWHITRYQTALAREKELEVIYKAAVEAARAERN